MDSIKESSEEDSSNCTLSQSFRAGVCSLFKTRILDQTRCPLVHTDLRSGPSVYAIAVCGFHTTHILVHYLHPRALAALHDVLGSEHLHE